MQRTASYADCGGETGFNPHRCRSTGATKLLPEQFSHGVKVSIPTGAGAPVQRWSQSACFARRSVSIPTGAGAPVQHPNVEANLYTHEFQSPPVPEHRCNRRIETIDQAAHYVSIPTGAGAPVQLRATANTLCSLLFQSPPVPEHRCNI